MKQTILIVLVVVIGVVSATILVEKDDDKILELKKIEGKDLILVKPDTENYVDKKKPKCNLEYLACVKKHGGSRKAHIKCGHRFLKCKKKCYKKCKHLYKRCMKKEKDAKKCKPVFKKCASKCPHLSKCAKKCRATLIKCKKSKGKNCLKNFLKCVKACKPKEGSSSHSHWYSNRNE